MFSYCFGLYFEFKKEVNPQEFENLLGLTISRFIDNKVLPNGKKRGGWGVTIFSEEYINVDSPYIDEEFEKFLLDIYQNVIDVKSYVKEHKGEVYFSVLHDEGIKVKGKSRKLDFKYNGFSLTRKSIKLLAKMNARVDYDSYLSQYSSYYTKEQ